MGKPRRVGPSRDRRLRKLRCEQLEDRRLLAVVTVDTPLDVIDFTDGVTSLREAIFATNLVAGHDEIVFDFGHDGPETILLELGELAITDSLTISGPGVGLLTIDAQRHSRIFDVDDFSVDTSIDVMIQGVKVANGAAALLSYENGGAIRSAENLKVQSVEIAGSVGRDGGGIYSLGSLTVVSSTFSGNVAKSSGGAIFAIGPLEITSSHIAGNSGAWGGGVEFSMSGSFNASMRIDTSTIENNGASRGGGISVFIGPGSSLGNRSVVVVDSVISGNMAEGRGGGIYVRGGASADIAVYGNKITDNQAGGYGGGVYVQSFGSSTVIARNTVSGNSAFGGGGIVARTRSTGTTVIDSNTVSDNVATFRGGGMVVSNLSAGSTTTIVNSTISGNESGVQGGGIQVEGDGGPVFVRHSTVTGNTTGAAPGYSTLGGGGIHTRVVTTTLDHTIVAGNTDLTGTAHDIAGVVNSSYSLIGFGGNFLGPLAVNGGPTQTHALLTGSPAINTGDPNFVGPPESDQRGFPYQRVSGGRIDIGAFESQPAPGDFNGDGEADAADLALWEADYGDQYDGLDFLAWQAMQPAPAEPALQALAAVPTATAPPAVAALEAAPPIIVTTHLDVVDFSDGLTSLREAIFAANLVPGAQTIEFDAGLYANGPATILLTQYVEWVSLIGKSALRITDDVTILGPGAELLALDASGLQINTDLKDGDGGRVLRIDDGDAARQINVTISGLTFTGADMLSSGGAVFSSENLVLSGLRLVDNYVSGYGGGLHVEGGRARIEDSLVSGNTSRLGGGVSVGTFIPTASLGAILEIVNCTIVDNHTTYDGGGVFAGFADLTITNSTISGNDLVRGEGGGVYALGRAENFVRIEDSTFSGNRAWRGGGLAVNRSTTSVANSTFSGNRAGGDGGGIFLYRNTAVIDRSTITANIASTLSPNHGRGGGLRASSGTLHTISHTIIAGNSDGSGYAEDAYGLFTANYSLLGVAYVPNQGLPYGSNNLFGVDPLLAPLVDNGGPTKTHALLPGSPAINRGDLSAVVGVGGVPEFDQRGEGYSRIFGGRIDIGAYEYQAASDLNLLVDTLVDESDGDYSRGDLSLREAIELANEWGGHDTIQFDAALAGGTILLVDGELAITDELTITGLGDDQLTIDAQDASRIFQITATAGDIHLTGLTLSGGLAEFGGAIYSATAGVLRIADSTITDNRATGGREVFGGGGVYAHGKVVVVSSDVTHNGSYGSGAGVYSLGDVEVLDSHIEHNEIFSFDPLSFPTGGGGIYAVGAVSIEASEVSHNSGGMFGGAILALGEVSLTEALVADNSSSLRGGGVYAEGFVEIVDSTLRGNTTQGAGGAISARDGLSLLRTTVDDNHATEVSGVLDSVPPAGGGIDAAGDVYVRDSTISGNSSKFYAGGLFVANGQLTLVNSTVSGNSAAFDGGGIALVQSHLVMQHTTVTDNSAGRRAGGIGAVFSTTAKTYQISHSIVAGNTAESVNPDWGLPSHAAIDHSLIGIFSSDPFGNGPTPPLNTNLIGTVSHPIDPLLAPLADNGGPTQTHLLLPGSPAINRGDLSAVAGVDGVPAFDQRGAGYARIFGGRIDIGAFEYQAASDLNLLVDTLVDESDGDYSRGDLSLREAILLANRRRGHDTIQFDAALAGGTIFVELGTLNIGDEATIQGLGREALTIDGQGQTQIFSGGTAEGRITIADMTLTNANGVIIGDSLILRGLHIVESFGNIAVVLAFGDFTLENSTFERNTGSTLVRVSSAESEISTIRATTFVDNDLSGAERAVQADLTRGGSMSIEDSFFSGDGIAVYLQDDSDFVLRSSTVKGARRGVNIEGSGHAVIESSTIAGNGIGLLAARSIAGRLTVRSSTVSGNVGGGIIASGDVTVAHSTVTNNISGGSPNDPPALGAVTVLYGSLLLDHSIVAGNVDLQGAPSDVAGVVSASYSLIGFGANYLGPLADNGGPTQTHALLPGSPALNAGNPNFAGPPDSDQRGFPYKRISGGRIDIGAFESQPLPGDFDHDNDADAEDLAVWEAEYGSELSGLDFLAWQITQQAPPALQDFGPSLLDMALAARLVEAAPTVLRPKGFAFEREEPVDMVFHDLAAPLADPLPWRAAAVASELLGDAVRDDEADGRRLILVLDGI